ncbi:MAG: oligosaccharide flippase family protein [Burkholderiales bacterium]|nr:oligosaccharide flippase family protein [Anaerolineae bacterium]
MNHRLRRFFQRKFVQDTLALQVSKLGITGLSFVSSIIITRLMGDTAFGTWGLVQALFLLVQALNLTGIGTSTVSRLAVAVGARNESEILDLMAYYVRVLLLWSLVSIVGLALAGPPLARLMYEGDAHIGMLSALYSLTIPADGIYGLVVIALQSRRSMREVAVLQNANQVVLVVCALAALAISPTADAIVIGRLAYSYLTMALGLGVYWRLRVGERGTYPPFRDVLRRARTVPLGSYWRFGVANALDKNFALIYTQLPMTLVGAVWGKEAAGHLNLALTALGRLSFFTSAIYDNMQAVVPQAVGRGDFVGLRRNFLRALAALTVSGTGFFLALAIIAPLVVPPIYGDEWLPAIPLIQALCIYGAVTTAGGIFGPLYRAFEQMRAALAAKIAATVIMLPLGVALVMGSGALGGAWMINGMYGLSIAFTAVFTLRALYSKAGSRREVREGNQAEIEISD